MKNKKTILVGLIALIMASCSSTSFYQVYKTTASEKINVKENSLVYEDQNCTISYNFWQNEGNIGFRFFNKTDQNIYLNLDESFFVFNGISNNYYKNRIFTHSESSGVVVSKGATASKSFSGTNYLNLFQTNLISASSSVDKTGSSGTSVSYNEEKIICIPPQTAKIISEYNINEYLFRDCDLLKYPTKKEVKSKNFTKSSSPIIFSNIIIYKLAQSETQNKVQNEFFVSEITNLPESEMYSSRYDEYCGEKSSLKSKYFVEQSPNNFYIRYMNKQDGIKN
jgi:hypothetical protein